MARADLEKLRKKIESKIKKDADKFRRHYVNKQTLIISHNNEGIINQAMIQMALREGYRTRAEFKTGLDKRFPGENVFSKIEQVIKKAVPNFNKKVYDAILAEKNKSNTPSNRSNKI